MCNTIWLSIGENCLTSDLLRRSNLYAPSTIYSHSRCTIGHVLQIEEGGYKELLNKDLLRKGTTHGDTDCVFSKLIIDGDLPFEFTHLNPLNKLNRLLLKSRIKRMVKARESENRKIFCYHHRSHDGFKADFKQELCLAVNTLSGLFYNSSFFFFTQKVVQEQTDRGISIDSANNYAFVELNSLNEWVGNDNIYGRLDDDLFKKTLLEIKKLLIKTP